MSSTMRRMRVVQKRCDDDTVEEEYLPSEVQREEGKVKCSKVVEKARRIVEMIRNISDLEQSLW